MIESLGDTVDFEYQGDTDQLFRGIATTSRPREVRRRFWILRDTQWTIKRHDPYEDLDSSPAQELEKTLRSDPAGLILPDSYKADPRLEGLNVFFTPSTVNFASRLVEAQRRLCRGRRLVAVTGSAGKTSTSAMVAHALQGVTPESKVQYSAQNRNGMHWSLSYMSRVHRFDHTVLEVSGAALAHRWKGWTVSPDVAIVTSIAEAHLDYHGTLEGVARDKSNIFRAPPRNGAAVVNIDSPHADILVARAEAEGARLVTYGESPEADIRLVGYDLTTGRVRASVVGLDVEYTLSAKGKHLALNSLAVLATLRDLGVDWAAGMASLRTFVQPKGRNREVKVPLDRGDFTLVDGSFNANSASVRASLLSIQEAKSRGRKVAVLGDILELGEHAEEVHRSLAPDVRAAGLDCLHLLGENFHKVHQAERNLAPEVHLWDDVDELIESLPGTLRKDDLVLIKGSGGMGLKKLAAHFIDRAEEAGV